MKGFRVALAAAVVAVAGAGSAQDSGDGGGPSAKDLLKRAGDLVYQPISDGIESLQADVVAEKGAVVVRISYEATGKAPAREDLRVRVLKNSLRGEKAEDAAAACGEYFRSALFGMNFSPKLDEARSVQIESGPGPIVALEGERGAFTRYHLDSASGLVVACELESAVGRRPMREARVYRPFGEKYLLVTRDYEYDAFGGMAGDVIANEYFPCGERMVPWRVVEGAGGEEPREFFLKGMRVDGKALRTPRESGDEEKDWKAAIPPWPWGKRSPRAGNVDIAMIPTTLKNLAAFVKVHLALKKSLPRSLADLESLDREDLLDPWGRPWIYEPRGKRSFRIGTLGADGNKGGTGDDADVFETN